MKILKLIWRKWVDLLSDVDDDVTEEELEKIGVFHRWVYESIFALAGGSAGDLQTGHNISYRYANWIRARKCRKKENRSR